MISGEEAAQAVNGIMRLARFDQTVSGLFGKDLAACRRSFTVYFYALPAIALLLAIAVIADDGSNQTLIWSAEIIASIIQIVGFPVVLRPLLRLYGKLDRWAWFVTAYNWFNAAQMGFIVFMYGLALGPLAGFGTWPLRGAQVYLLVLEAFLAESVLQVGGIKALAVVLLDVFFGLGVEQVARWIGTGTFWF